MATTAEARARMDRAFTMPQFVTSVAGYGGSARAKQVGQFFVPCFCCRMRDCCGGGLDCCGEKREKKLFIFVFPQTL